MSIKKAGTILLDVKTKNIGLIYRKKQNDYSFPKGHLDEGESYEECALRETEEETGLVCKLISNELPVVNYIDGVGDNAEVHFYLARPLKKSNKIFSKELVHELIWIPYNEVSDKLTYSNLKELWEEVKQIIDVI